MKWKTVYSVLAFAAVFPLAAQTIDPFNPNANGRVRAFGVQSDGKLIIGGEFTSVGGVTRNRLARVLPDGTVDSSFAPSFNGVVLDVAVQPDDKVLVGGGFNQVGTTTRNRIARLNSDGTLDTGFNPNANEWVRALALQSDGKILVGGAFTQIGGQSRSNLARLETSGTADLGFNPGANAQVNALHVQPDGKIITGGYFTTLAGQTRNYVGRLNANGTLDAPFNPNAGSEVWRLALQNDGMIVIGGGFSSLGGQTRSNIARVHPSGALDTSFNPVANSTVNSLSIRLDGKILAGGNFTAIAGGARSYIASLNPNGTLDAAFTNTANATLYGIFQQPDGRVIAGGDFTTFGGQSRNRIVRMSFSPMCPPERPLNDNFACSIVLGGLKHFVMTMLTNATAEAGEPSHYYQEFAEFVSPSNTLWWNWTAPANLPVVIDTTGSGLNPALAVYAGNAANNLTLVASNYFNEQQSSSRSRVGFNAAAGQIYSIAVDGLGFSGVVALHLLAGTNTANDFFANAYEIPSGTLSVSGSNLNATREPGEPEHSFQSQGRSIWWRWTAQTTGPVTLDVAGSSFSPMIAVYTGISIDNLTLVTDDDDFEESSVTFQAFAGATYRIVVDDEKDSGEVVLNFRQRPPNDNFANRIALGSTVSFTTFGENRRATEEVEPNHANAYGTKSVWWQWTAPSSGLFTLDSIGSSINPAIGLYTGSTLAGLTPIGNDDGFSKSATRVRFSANQGTTYQIAVDADFNGDGGDIVLNLAAAEPILIANNNFANRINITQFPTVIRGANIGADREDVFNEVPFDSDNTLWWRFVAPANGIVTLQKLSGVPSLRFAILEGTSVTSLTVLADNQNLDSNPPRIDCATSLPVRGGNTYLISVGNSQSFFEWTAALDQGDFSIAVSFTPAPVNDNFANRIAIPAGTLTVTGTTVAAGLEPGEPRIGTNFNSIWWSYTPTVSGPIMLTTVGSAIDTALGVYTGSAVNGLTQIATNDAAYRWQVLAGPSFDRPSRVKFNGVAGTPYRIAVSTARDMPGEVQLNFPTLAIEDILSILTTLQPDRTMDFTANLRLTNVRNSPSGLLRIRVFARAGYSHLDGLFQNCGKELPAMNVADQEIAVFDLASSLSAQSSVDLIVSHSCAPPYEAGEWGQGWGAMAVLEEFSEESGWEVRDSRLLAFGNWPRVGGFIGPGGGVITVASGMGQVLATPGFIDVSVGPPAAVRLGARWRVTPGNCGSVCTFTNFTDQAVSLATRQVDFTIDVTAMPGFRPPTNQAIRLRAGLHTPLNLIYEVNPPRLFYNRTTGLSITGTPGTAYRIETASRLRPPNWSSNAGRTLTAGQNTIPNTTPASNTNRFYRALWLSN